MARLAARRLRLWARDYLTHRSLWPAIEAAVGLALDSRPLNEDATVVDIGCGQRPYADLFGDAFCVALDRSTQGARPSVVADVLHLPLASACADLVFCTQVIEHVQRPQRLLDECCRIMKPGGMLVLTGPFYWPLHEEPHDYFRFTRYGLEQLARQAGLQVVTLQNDCGSLTQLAVSLVELLPRWALPLLPVINVITPWLQRLSSDRRSTLNLVMVARRP